MNVLKRKIRRLTRSDLRALWEQCPTPEMRAALWEIYELRQTIAEAHRLTGLIRSARADEPQGRALALESLKSLLQNEHAVLEHPQEVEDERRRYDEYLLKKETEEVLRAGRPLTPLDER